MADHHANPFDEPLEKTHMTGTGLAVDGTGAAAVTRWIPTLEAFVADLRRMATAHPEHSAHSAHTPVSTGGIRNQQLHLVPARAGRQPEGDAAAGAMRATSRSLKRTGTRPLLTRRETEILALTEVGCNAAEIAETLRLAKGTVYVHRRNARRKQRQQRQRTDPLSRTTGMATSESPFAHQ